MEILVNVLLALVLVLLLYVLKRIGDLEKKLEKLIPGKGLYAQEEPPPQPPPPKPPDKP